MASPENITDQKPKTDLFVSFWHEGKVEASATCTDPSSALIFAVAVLKTRDGLYAGDELRIDDLPRLNLIERGLA